MSAPHAVRGSSGLTEAQVTAALPELEQYIQEQMKRTGVPGLSIAIVLRDKVVYLKGFGVREAGKNDPVSEDTAFQLASVSKPLGATVIASLVSDGLIAWDSKISDLDPSFQLREPYPTSQLTIRDLYAHRSGLPGEAGTELETFGYSQTEILHRLRYVPPASSFRSAYSYSDFGMTEGGVAAVKPTGKTWEQVSKEKLYTPLGMTHTTSVNSEFLQETNRAALHVMVDGKWTPKLTRQPET
jgi:CubicO group peptidase (beta-lactamase class C family)